MNEEKLYPEGLPEAPASLNFYGVTSKGWNLQVTLRDNNEQRLFKRFAVLSEWMETNGITAKPVGQQPSNGSKPEAQTGNYPGDTFTVENIKLASGGEHPRWVVQGGNFRQYGVTCWPETLKEAGILDHLDPLKDNNPQGTWTAHYQKKVDGKPDKVVKLVRES